MIGYKLTLHLQLHLHLHLHLQLQLRVRQQYICIRRYKNTSHMILVLTRSYYRKESAASSPFSSRRIFCPNAKRKPELGNVDWLAINFAAKKPQTNANVIAVGCVILLLTCTTGIALGTRLTFTID